MKKMAAVIMGVALAGLLATSEASFILLDDFESYSTGTITNQSANWSSAGTVFGATVDSSGGNQYLNNGNVNNIHTAYDNGSILIADGATGTYFFRVYMPGTAHGGTAISPSAAADSDAWGDGKGIVRFGTRGGTTEVFAYNDTTYAKLADGQSGAWYNVWMLIDNTTARDYDIYMQSDDDPAFATQTQIGADLGFRQSIADGDLKSLFFRSGIDAGDSVYYDDLYIDSTAHTLINPIPEPGTLGLIAVFGGGILFIRRRSKK